MDVKGMRDIIFRGKRIDNGEWVEGYLYEHEPALVGISSENDAPKPSKWFIAKTGFADWNMPRPVEFVEIDHSTVGQYTGLCDKNGKKIFEGDIVAIERGWNETVKYHVFFDPQICGFIGDPINYIGFTTFGDDGINMEVIGNIHDNPELLEDFDKET